MGKILTIEHTLVKFVRLFHRQSFTLYGSRVIVPEVLQGYLLNELHYTHSGIVKMKLLACSYMWWPNLDQNIENLLKSCRECATQRSVTPVAPLCSWPWANLSMKRLHIDFADIEGWQVLVIIDVHSKWIEVVPLWKATAATTVSVLQTFLPTLGYLKNWFQTMDLSLLHKSFATVMESNTLLPHLITLLQTG